MEQSRRTHLAFASRLDQITPVQDAVLAEVEAAGFPEQAVFAIRLALDEALVNAVRHGNGLDAKKQVTVDYQVSGDRFEVCVCDQGEGFRPEALPDPTSEQNLTRPNGRGVMLMRAYMTEVAYNERGNCVRMVKLRGCRLPDAD